MTLQCEMNAGAIKKKLEGYSPVRPVQLKTIKPGDRIRYMINNEFRGGGAVKSNKYPDYIVLINVINKATWCMQLKDPTLKVWLRPLESIVAERDDMSRVYEMYKQGKLVKKK